MRWLRMVAMFGALALAASAAAQDRAALERRLQSVATLIESSSAAKQIEASRDPQAYEKRARARALHREAAAAYANDDLPGTAKRLDEATRAMVEGARLAAPEQITGDKKRTDFENRIKSVQALLAAQQRIAAEKSAGQQAAEASRRIETLIAQATKQAAADQLDEARATADQAYLIAKVSIESLRRGDTLVRSLNFADKRAEYDYELDRNDTHRMLVQVLLSERRASDASIDRTVQRFLDAAAKLRATAEQQAAQGDHAGAVRSLEDSTRELVRAIRNAGVYIPG